jgi:hypothetical protein
LKSISRREFLSNAAHFGAVAALGAGGMVPVPQASAFATPCVSDRKLIVVLFGGGTRSSESIDDPEHRYIPRLWNQMVPQGTLFSNMRVEGKVVHPNSTGSIVTGHWEWDDLDWSKPVAHPTIFEVFRKYRGAADTSAWAFVYASILSNAGYSKSEDFGQAFSANVVEPPSIPRTSAEKMDRLMQHATAAGSVKAEVEAAAECERIARQTSRIALGGIRSPEAIKFIDAEYSSWKNGTGTTSHDAFLTERAISCMRTFSPDVMLVAFGEIDCAHYGSWSRYVEAIRRADELTWRLWQAAGQLEQYRDRTMMLILPDHGRELDRPGHWGFIHHSNFYTNEGADEGCRRVWMLALGPGVSKSNRIEKPIPITTVAATGLEFLGLEKTEGAELSVLDQLSI